MLQLNMRIQKPTEKCLQKKKIIKGGQGVWGEIPMAPHADLTQAQAEAMAMYVLSLKK